MASTLRNGSLFNLANDAATIAEFKEAAGGNNGRNELHLQVFEWNKEDTKEIGTPLSKVEDLYTRDATRDATSTRIVFAPRDLPAPSTVQGMTSLFEHYEIPGSFIRESLEGVSQSFGTRTDECGIEYIWFHFLLKGATIAKKLGKYTFIDPEFEVRPLGQTQASFAWNKPGFVLKVEPGGTIVKGNSPSAKNSNAAALVKCPHRITLFCFGAPERVAKGFERLATTPGRNDVFDDPYLLLDIVLEEMWLELNQGVRWASKVFLDIEKETLKTAETNDNVYSAGFAGLHNVSKHIIYLQENTAAALSTVSHLLTHHEHIVKADPRRCRTFTHSALQYRKTLFESTKQRVLSLEKRMANIIQLSFNLVTKADSRIMQIDSKSMKTIAVATLIFLPISTVAAVFGTQLVQMSDTAPYHIQVSQDFWLLWVISAPLTGIVLLMWRLWYIEVKQKVQNENYQRRQMRLEPSGRSISGKSSV